MILANSIKFKLEFNFKEALNYDAQTDCNCYDYNNIQTFDISKRSVIYVSIDTYRLTCDDHFNPKDRSIWFMVIIISFAAIQAILLLRYLLKAFRRYKKL